MSDLTEADRTEVWWEVISWLNSQVGTEEPCRNVIAKMSDYLVAVHDEEDLSLGDPIPESLMEDL